jgi:hypothetical protein
MTLVRWCHDGWRGVLDVDAGVSPGDVLGAARDPDGRPSRHARTRRLPAAQAALWLKVYPAPGGWRAWRAWRMARALAAAGFAVADGVLCGRRRGEGVLVTRDVGGRPLLEVLGTASGPAKRELLGTLGRTVGALHARGFVHGDLVPSNLQVCGGTIVLLDHDRTRRGRLLVWWGGRRNLVQLGRFVVPGVRVVDRVRVLCAYAQRRGLGRRARHRLARWVATKTVARRRIIDRVPAAAVRAGYATVMRTPGAHDPCGPGPGAGS